MTNEEIKALFNEIRAHEEFELFVERRPNKNTETYKRLLAKVEEECENQRENKEELACELMRLLPGLQIEPAIDLISNFPIQTEEIMLFFN